MALDVLNRRDVTRLAAQELGMSDRDVDRVMKKVLEVSVRALGEGTNVSLRGFGTFEPRVMDPVVRHRPDTLEPVLQPAHVRIIFRPSKTLKARINQIFQADPGAFAPR